MHQTTPPDAPVIVGAGGHGREVAWTALRAGVQLRGFYDDKSPAPEILEELGLHRLGPSADVGGQPAYIGIGDGTVRRRLSTDVIAAAPLVDPLAAVSPGQQLGGGSVVFAMATVTTNVTIGLHVHIGRNAAVGHDVVLHDFASLMPGCSIAGAVVVGPAAYIGAGATVRQGIRIGEGAVVGMGAAVVSDVPDGVTVVGVPARVIGR